MSFLSVFLEVWAVFIGKKEVILWEGEENADMTRWINIIPHVIKKGIGRRPLNSSTEIRLTRLCTQRCRQCRIYERTTEPSSMSWESFRVIAQRLRDYGAYIGFISGGEATLVPHLDKILLEAKKTFLHSTTLVTGLYHKTETIQRLGRLALMHNVNIQTSLDGLGEIGDDLRGVQDFATTVLGHMEWLSKNKGNSKSLLYANIVINNRNLDQVPELMRRANDIGWKTTVGVYHSITSTTRMDDALTVRPGGRLDRLLKFLDNNRDILNLNAFINGIGDFVNGKPAGFCAFVDAPVLATRTTIMENGDVHLCFGEPIGNLLQNTMGELFDGDSYKQRITEYRSCQGCWTTCYTQRYLLVHPRSMKELFHNIKKVRALRK